MQLSRGVTTPKPRPVPLTPPKSPRGPLARTMSERARLRLVLERVGDCPNILEIEQAVSMLRAHLDVLRSKHVEISRQIEQTATLVDTRAA